MSILERIYRDRNTPKAHFIDAVAWAGAAGLLLTMPNSSWWETPAGWVCVGFALSAVGQWLDALAFKSERKP